MFLRYAGFEQFFGLHFDDILKFWNFRLEPNVSYSVKMVLKESLKSLVVFKFF